MEVAKDFPVLVFAPSDDEVVNAARETANGKRSAEFSAKDFRYPGRQPINRKFLEVYANTLFGKYQ